MGKDIGAAQDGESRLEAERSLLENKSHEIRTYMTRIISMTDLTLMTEVTEEQRGYLSIVKSSTGLLLKVINDILDYSNIQTGSTILEHIPFNIRQTVQEVIQLFAVAAGQKHIQLSLNSWDQRIPENLLGDPGRLKQVLSSLVGNGIRFTKHGKVTVDVDLREGHARHLQVAFTVSDTGIGIPEDKLVTLFQGMGLKNSLKLAELMDGTITVDSKAGAGSKFCLTAVFGIPGEGGSDDGK